MKLNQLPVILSVLLLAVLTVPPASAQDVSLSNIAPGLTGSALCPLIRSNPQAAVDAVAAGAIRAYDAGPAAVKAFAATMGDAVFAAEKNGCIDDLFEGVNQAILKGGEKVEYVTGKALALGVAQGTASSGGQILAKATAKVICRGGASASACAKAWNQAIKFDPINGCAVLVQAYVHAQAYCTKGVAMTKVQSTVFKYPLGECRAPGLTSSNPGGSNIAAGSVSPGGAIIISQGPNGNKITAPDGTTITQGPGLSAAVYTTSGVGDWWSKKFGQFAPTQVYQGPEGQQVVYGGRKMLRSGDRTVVEARGFVKASGARTADASSTKYAVRKLQQDGNFGNFQWPFNSNIVPQQYSKNTANNYKETVNTGYIDGPMRTVTIADAKGVKFAGGNGSFFGQGFGTATANAASKTVNTGYVKGPVESVSIATAGDRR